VWLPRRPRNNLIIRQLRQPGHSADEAFRRVDESKFLLNDISDLTVAAVERSSFR
jgi:hypothetical protein